MTPDGKLVVDLFAGGGGASTGLAMAGCRVDIAVNHNASALAIHATNHPEARHYQSDVYEVDPIKACGGKKVGVLWCSPDCTQHTKARAAAKPKSERIRGLAWVAVRWAATVSPDLILLENVEEFRDWGPLDAEGQPVKALKGATFREFVSKLESLGYTVEHQVLTSYRYGAPTSRARLVLIARKHGTITWPVATHEEPGLASEMGIKPWRPVSACVDWTIPCRSIFLSKDQARQYRVRRPLKEATLRRTALGIRKFLLDDPDPFIVPDPWAGCVAGLSDKSSAVAAFIRRDFGQGVGQSVKHPSATITGGGGGHSMLVAAYIMKMRGDNLGHRCDSPLQTITGGGNHFATVTAFMLKYYGTAVGHPLNVPAHTVTGNDRFGLVTLLNQEWGIADIGMRMLTPRELARAQGFPEDYNLLEDRLSKSTQVKMIGNSVPPDLAYAVAHSNR